MWFVTARYEYNDNWIKAPFLLWRIQVQVDWVIIDLDNGLSPIGNKLLSNNDS